jgi:hypothetical protein
MEGRLSKSRKCNFVQRRKVEELAALGVWRRGCTRRRPGIGDIVVVRVGIECRKRFDCVCVYYNKKVRRDEKRGNRNIDARGIFKPYLVCACWVVQM